MFSRMRLFYHKRLFLTFNKDLYRLVDDWAAGRCSEEFFTQKSQELFQILESYFDRAFALSRQVEGVPDQTLSAAMEATRNHLAQSRFRQAPLPAAGRDSDESTPTAITPESEPDEITVELANRYYQRSADEMKAFIEQALKDCRGPDGSLNGQAMFVRLLDGFLRDEFTKTAEELNGRPPGPGDLVNAQLRALEECNNANSYCFQNGQFRLFRVMVEQNLDSQKFFEEHLSIYEEVTQALHEKA